MMAVQFNENTIQLIAKEMGIDLAEAKGRQKIKTDKVLYFVLNYRTRSGETLPRTVMDEDFLVENFTFDRHWIAIKFVTISRNYNY